MDSTREKESNSRTRRDENPMSSRKPHEVTDFYAPIVPGKLKPIYEIFCASMKPLTPSDVYTRQTDNKRAKSTVRTYCRELYKLGLISQDAPRLPYKVVNPGVGWGNWKLHNVDFKLQDKIKVNSAKKVFEFSDVTLTVTFGAKRSKVTAKIRVKNNELGLSLREWRMLITIFLDYVNTTLNRRLNPTQILVTHCEIANDHYKKRVDGLQNYTLYDFNGVVQRIYQKHKDVRVEVAIPSTVTASELETLLSSGIPVMNFQRDLTKIMQQIHALSKLLGEILLILRTRIVKPR